MTITDKTSKTSAKAVVHIKCEGIRTTGRWCEESIELSFSRMNDAGKALTPAQRKSMARSIATKDGWRSPKGFDECPRVHGFMPTAKDTGGKG